MMYPIKERNIVTCILLTVVTCGIYGLYWLVCIADDMKKASNDQSLPSGGMVILLTLVTCGIYGYYWIWKMGKANLAAKTMRGMPAEDNSILYLILQFVGLGIVNYCLIQSDLNQYAAMSMQQGKYQNMNQYQNPNMNQYQNPNMNQYQDPNQNNNQNMGV